MTPDRGTLDDWPALAELALQTSTEKQTHVTPEIDPTAFGAFNDIPGDTTTPWQLEVGWKASAQISFRGDTDWFRIDLKAGQTYEISLTALNAFGNPLGNPLLSLRDDTGTQLTFNDDAFQTTDSLLSVTASRSGTYFIGATGFGGGQSTTGD